MVGIILEAVIEHHLLVIICKYTGLINSAWTVAVLDNALFVA